MDSHYGRWAFAKIKEDITTTKDNIQNRQTLHITQVSCSMYIESIIYKINQFVIGTLLSSLM